MFCDIFNHFSSNSTGAVHRLIKKNERHPSMFKEILPPCDSTELGTGLRELGIPPISTKWISFCNFPSYDLVGSP